MEDKIIMITVAAVYAVFFAFVALMWIIFITGEVSRKDRLYTTLLAIATAVAVFAIATLGKTIQLIQN